MSGPLAFGEARGATVILDSTEGQLWTHEQLRALHAARFSPAAIGAFLLASQRRTNAVRAARPELARQAQMWIGVGAGAWVVLAARGPRAQVRLWMGLAWWGACALMVDWHLGMVQTLDGRPRRLGPADALTLARAWLVPLAWKRPTALTCAVAGLSDAIDGPLARRRGEPTRAGRDFDWIIDACFASAALRGASRHGLLTRWAVRAEATWLGFGVLRALYAYFLQADEPDRSITRPARPFAALRMAGLIGGSAGRRRAGSAMLGTGALASLAVSGCRLARRSAPAGAESASRRPGSTGGGAGSIAPSSAR